MKKYRQVIITVVLICVAGVVSFFAYERYEEDKIQEVFGVSVHLPITDDDRAALQPAVTKVITELYLQEDKLEKRRAACSTDNNPITCSQSVYEDGRTLYADVDRTVNLATRFHFAVPDFSTVVTAQQSEGH